MTNNQTKYSIVCEKIVMRASDDERLINSERPKVADMPKVAG